MKSWNAHAWYVTGILLALLVGILSVEWSSVERLPEILSFAVGFSSLLLAIFTIIQSMTTTSDSTAALASVREAASGLRETAAGVNSAASDVSAIASGLLESSEANRQAISELASELKAKSQSSESSENASIVGPLSVGSGPAFLAALLGYKTNRPVNFSRIFPGDQSLIYEHGAMGGLEAAGAIKHNYSDGTFTITEVNGQLDSMIDSIRRRKFTPESRERDYQSRIKIVDKYFEREDSAD